MYGNKGEDQRIWFVFASGKGADGSRQPLDVFMLHEDALRFAREVAERWYLDEETFEQRIQWARRSKEMPGPAGPGQWPKDLCLSGWTRVDYVSLVGKEVA